MEYKRIELNAATARTDVAIDLGKQYTNVLFLVNDVEVEYRLNSTKCDKLYTSELQGFEGEVVVNKLFITNAAGTGKIVILAYR